MKVVLDSSQYIDLKGTIRAKFPRETLSYLTSHLLSYGITRVAHLTGMDATGVPVSTCIRPNAKHLATSQGKGLTQELSDISAIMEAIEGYHMENPPVPELRTSYVTLKNQYSGLPIEWLGNYGFHKKNLAELQIPWRRGVNLINGADCYVPHALIDLDSSVRREDFLYFSISTNGLAAGNSMEEATLHALYEIVERDALYHWQRLSSAEKKETLVNANSITFLPIRILLEKINTAYLGIKIWEITSDIKIPAYQCALYEKGYVSGLGVFTGSGAHLSKEVALIRAILESIQSRVTLISGGRDDISMDFYQYQQSLFLQSISVEQTQGSRDFLHTLTVPYKHSFSDNLIYVTQLLQSQGHHLIVRVEHARLPIPVCQVFIPSLKFHGARM